MLGKQSHLPEPALACAPRCFYATEKKLCRAFYAAEAEPAEVAPSVSPEAERRRPWNVAEAIALPSQVH